MTFSAQLRHAAEELAAAKSRAADVLERWSELGDVDASSGDVERAIGLLGTVADDLDAAADACEWLR